MAEAPDEEVDRLYGLALEEFIPARDALARQLRDAGRRGEATAIKALKKPTVAAWAANQAVRSQPRAARELWDAGDALAAAQEAVLAGKGSGGDLRAAAERERLALDPLVDAARGLLTSSGGDLSETTIDRVRATLQAAAIDADVREEVAEGRAVREREPRGLFGGEAAGAAPTGRDRSAGTGTEGKAARGRSPDRDRSAADAAREREEAAAARKRGRDRSAGTGPEGKASRGRSPDRDRSAADAAREREEAAAARKREREEKAARERVRKAAAARVARAENALAAAEARSAKAAEALEDARAREREAVEALADARAELRAAER